jgi:hypothetical protein
MGRIAERRAQNDKVRNFCAYLVQRHQQAQQRLQNVADQLGEVLSSKLSQRIFGFRVAFAPLLRPASTMRSSTTKLATTATFYSISRRQRVLAALLFGNMLQARL